MPRLPFRRDQNVAGVLYVGNQAQIGPWLLFRVHARFAVGVPQELDRDRSEVDRAKPRRVSWCEDFGHRGIRLI